ncbi:MAG TPA: hypothetical protein VL463_18505 [Kofleriaceae bacterium]|nr:hypothetical protein [Kofleriaceae bacterium]
MSDLELEAAVAQYRDELTAEAELARGDLDEIEDHLRALIEELRAAGRGADAIAIARMRLGDPRDVAREHARVRTPFGARPSRAQAWSAALLVTPLAGYVSWLSMRHAGAWSFAGLELVLSAIVIAGLWARQAWARGVVLGHAVSMIVPCALAMWLWPDPRLAAAMLAIYAGAAVFLWPRRRGELSPTGIGLALLAPAYNGAIVTLAYQMTRDDGSLIGHPWAYLAVGAAIAAGAGLLVRARWGCVAAVVSAGATLRSGYDVLGLTFRFEHPVAQQAIVYGWIVGGALAAAGAALIAWRHARPGLGTLRDVISG